jgi:hypothetical protein
MAKREAVDALGFSCSIRTHHPIAIATGLGVRKILSPGSEEMLIVNGIFDSSALESCFYKGSSRIDGS